MSVPQLFKGRLSLPAIAAPMFLVSGPELVIASCKSGVVGTFPALNQRTSEGYAAWLDEIVAALDDTVDAPFGINLIVHKSNPRVAADLELTVKHRVPLVITSLGAVRDVVDAVHSYGGLVFHDVINIRHAEKALEAGVDGIIAVCAGAGGHAGTYNPFAFISELRPLLGDKTLILSGCLSNGESIAGAIAAGADLAYLGTRFIATRESRAPDAYKMMVCDTSAKDILYTPKVSGVPASFLEPSLVEAGFDPARHVHDGEIDFGSELDPDSKAWKNIWSAGQGVGGIHDVPMVRELCARLRDEYQGAIQRLTSAGY
ncbi:NAD(P)H-dependent flavin oxidoreductase [Govanella unica]|uniref:Nitronate monooxygenase family protein n=1 Tax=Govanella unica TaxID=2975056 RepID=A0A9X3Z762_9PROT|nr:nitronate monooxygenase family protein [Govania unica]MDA5193905.1 nitronate monooxygenase family protein [Govania unica]